jgi:hypothetical protein
MKLFGSVFLYRHIHRYNYTSERSGSSNFFLSYVEKIRLLAPLTVLSILLYDQVHYTRNSYSPALSPSKINTGNNCILSVTSPFLVLKLSIAASSAGLSCNLSPCRNHKILLFIFLNHCFHKNI